MLTGPASIGGTPEEVIWEGGAGYLIVNGFTVTSGTPKIYIQATLSGGFPDPLGQVTSGLPNPIPASAIDGTITAGGIYPFSSPEGTLIIMTTDIQSGDVVSIGKVWVQK